MLHEATWGKILKIRVTIKSCNINLFWDILLLVMIVAWRWADGHWRRCDRPYISTKIPVWFRLCEWRWNESLGPQWTKHFNKLKSKISRWQQHGNSDALFLLIQHCIKNWIGLCWIMCGPMCDSRWMGGGGLIDIIMREEDACLKWPPVYLGTLPCRTTGTNEGGNTRL